MIFLSWLALVTLILVIFSVNVCWINRQVNNLLKANKKHVTSPANKHTPNIIIDSVYSGGEINSAYAGSWMGTLKDDMYKDYQNDVVSTNGSDGGSGSSMDRGSQEGLVKVKEDIRRENLLNKYDQIIIE